MSRCLYCYKELGEGMKDFHPACARKFFGARTAPELPYVRAQLGDLARQVVRSQTTLTGVQAKLSLDINRGGRNEPDRFTIVGLFSDGELCYITRRIDRLPDGRKVAMEDMCQLSERLTEYKYKGSYEQIAKLVRRYSSAPQLDVINFWEVVVFCWITGNADMHLKNFSLYNQIGGYTLTPAYDMLSTSLVMPEDTEELALTLNGKKSRLRKADFYKAITASGVDEKVIENLSRRFSRALPKWFELIDNSFLPDDMKKQYKQLILRRVVMLR